jgi:hypothetical protein
LALFTLAAEVVLLMVAELLDRVVMAAVVAAAYLAITKLVVELQILAEAEVGQKEALTQHQALVALVL